MTRQVTIKLQQTRCSRARYWANSVYSPRLLAVMGISLSLVAANVSGRAQADPTFTAGIPQGLQGPFIANPAVMAALDCSGDDCSESLSFAKLVQARAKTSPIKDRFDINPFNLKVSAQIVKLIEKDLDDLAKQSDASEHQINKNFLIDAASRVELVGAVNRMDRQFIKDTSQGLTKKQLACGEVSLIYRFGYSLTDRDQKSRLPITLNLVFPALPSNDNGGTVSCQTIAQRWLNTAPEVHRLPDPSTPEDAKKAAAKLLDKSTGPLAFIDGKDILRIELNIQAYRKPAGIVKDFGTEAAYVIRVFKWLPDKKYFDADFLRNQIDRDKVLCRSDRPAECAANEARRRKLVAYLSRPDVLQSVDWGTLEVDYGLGVLSERGLSVSPGGSHRSLNQAYWNANTRKEQLISDAEIEVALRYAKTRGIRFSFIKSVDDFRTRLNESTCTGCHQTRAIAGFHFPGSDREKTSPVNAVLLPGSPQFYGDQPRRLEIVRKIAAGVEAKQFDLATGYSARPMNRFASSLVDTKLLGGWGGACLGADARKLSQRQWGCQSRYECVRLYESDNNKLVGTCVPLGGSSSEGATAAAEIGDALQKGEITTKAFGKDRYSRYFPNKPASGQFLIPNTALPPDPPGNSYYGAHQEYYEGTSDWNDKTKLRDSQTGGFPAGMLRLSECTGLSTEATCGLIASTGFNTCVARLGSGQMVDGKNYTIDTCFEHFTSYAGLRACSAGSPCRDDYICVKPMSYSARDADRKFDERRTALLQSRFFPAVNNHTYDPKKLFGQAKPDSAWAARNDGRGLCIPPYFVFQFRADGHPGPK